MATMTVTLDRPMTAAVGDKQVGAMTVVAGPNHLHLLSALVAVMTIDALRQVTL